MLGLFGHDIELNLINIKIYCACPILALPIVLPNQICCHALGKGAGEGRSEVAVVFFKVKRDHLDFLAGVAASWVFSTLPLLAFLKANCRMK